MWREKYNVLSTCKNTRDFWNKESTLKKVLQTDKKTRVRKRRYDKIRRNSLIEIIMKSSRVTKIERTIWSSGV